MIDYSFIAYLYVFVIGVCSGLVGATMGAGGLVTIPGLMLMGFPAAEAIATNRMSAIGLWAAAFNRFRKSNKIIWEYVPILSVLAVIGGLLGAYAVLLVPENVLKIVVSFCIVLTLVLLIYKKEAGIKKYQTSTLKRWLGYLFYFVIAIYGGFFGGGVVSLFIIILIFQFGFPMVEASATSAIPWILLSFVCLLFFATHGLVNYKYGAIMTVGAIIGGHTGANLIIKKGDGWMKKIFIAGMALVAIKLAYDSFILWS